MAFVNEYISLEDREKYKIDERTLRLNPRLKGILPSYYTPYWTIDRERNVFMEPNGSWVQLHDDDPWIGFRLVIDNDLDFEFKLNYAPGASVEFTDNPFYKVWDFKSMNEVANPKNIPQKEIVQLLKEALAVYGYLGAGLQVKNTVVIFNF
jgi:hypothetical protein